MLDTICHFPFFYVNYIDIIAINFVFHLTQSVICRDMSNNSFDVSEIPQWFSPTLESLTTL